jgi:mannose-6-phosphate isomerase
MNNIALYPLRFQPIYEYRLWGGRRLGHLLSTALPGDGPIGEAWVLSDRDEHPSVVASGALAGSTLRQLLQQAPERLLGSLSGNLERFPLLLKFLDVSDRLSVQVHPSDAHTELLSASNSGKDEAWVVIEQGPEARIYAGLQPGTSERVLRQAVASGGVPQQLASFAPDSGDSVFIQAGTVHALSDVVVFEVQQNSDVTFRLYDWNHVDPKSGQPRPLQVEQAMECIDFSQGAVGPGTPLTQQTRPVLRELLVDSDHFDVTRITGQVPFDVGAADAPRVLVGLSGSAQLQHGGVDYPLAKGDVLLLAAELGACSCRPTGVVSVLEIALPHENPDRL